jgi:hypothetical protein
MRLVGLLGKRLGGEAGRLRIVLLVIGSLVLIGAVSLGTVFYVRYIRSEMAANNLMRAKAENELSPIKRMPSSNFIRHSFLSKGEHGDVEDSYRSQSSYESIRGYYDQEFANQGWKFQNEQSLKIWWKEVGVKEESYGNAGLQVYVYFVGAQETKENITYIVGTSWGTDRCATPPPH